MDQERLAAEAKEYQLSILRKKLRTKRNFLRTVRTVGGGAPQAEEIIQRHAQETDTNQRELMTSMLQEMKGMKRTSAKSYVKDVTKGMTTEQLQLFRQQAGPSMQHLIPTRSTVLEVNPATVYQPGTTDAPAVEEPGRGFQRLNASVPSLKDSHQPIQESVFDLPVPRQKTLRVASNSVSCSQTP